jgi:cytochrome c oxidase cbb3-type subunit I/II
MWKEFNDSGTMMYPNFMETVSHLIPMYFARAVGGTLYIVGISAGMYNLFKTMKSGSLIADEKAEANVEQLMASSHKESSFHRWLESKPTQFTVLTVVAILIGGFIEYIPTALVKSNVPTIASVKPYTPLELVGRDIYIAEGCVGCHSQMIRPFRSETERYGEYSKAGEFVYDRPFLWGSKRTGPDLHRVGGKYPDSWHYMHFLDSRSTSPGSIMPSYSWFLTRKIDVDQVPAKIRTLQTLGVPYPDGFDKKSVDALRDQATGIADGLKSSGFDVEWDAHMVAVIAYLQRLGTDINGDTQANTFNKFVETGSTQQTTTD